jgi:hypothetical protein
VSSWAVAYELRRSDATRQTRFVLKTDESEIIRYKRTFCSRVRVYVDLHAAGAIESLAAMRTLVLLTAPFSMQHCG